MTSVPFWGKNPAIWCKDVPLGSYRLPGLVSVEVDAIALTLDRQKAAGKSGGALVNKGYKPIRVTVNVQLWTEAHHTAMSGIIPRINPRRENALKEPMEFKHPSVNEFDLGPWVVASISPGTPSARGGRIIKIILEEWFPDAKKAKKATGKVVPAVTTKSLTGDLVGMSMYGTAVDESVPDPTSGTSLSSMIGDLTGTNRQ